MQRMSKLILLDFSDLGSLKGFARIWHLPINVLFTVTSEGRRGLNNHGNQDQGRQCGAEIPKPALTWAPQLMHYGHWYSNPTNCEPQANAALPQLQGALQTSVSAVQSLQKLQGEVGQRAVRKGN